MTEPHSKPLASVVPSMKQIPFARLIGMLVAVLIGVAWMMYSSGSLSDFKSGCGKGRDEAHVSLPETLYGPLMRLRFHPPSPRAVSMVTISDASEPSRIMTNTCESRKFLTDLVPQLAVLRPRVIVIDKYYSKDACDDQVVNAAFILALNGASIPPVVVGQPAIIDESSNDCLCLKPALNFNPPTGKDGTVPSAAGSNVHLGLIDLNRDDRKIPLQWWTHTTPEEPGKLVPASMPVKGLAYVAVEQSDPDVTSSADLQWFLDHDEHPFGSFPADFKTSSAMNVLCQSASGAALVQQHRWGDCAQVKRTQLYVTGKVIVIGELVDSDLHPFAGGPVYGSLLHASYINSLLEGYYVRSLPLGMELILILLAALFTAIWDLELYNKFFHLKKETILLIDIGFFIVLVLVNVVALEIGYFAPLFLLASGGFLLGFLIMALEIIKEKLGTHKFAAGKEDHPS